MPISFEQFLSKTKISDITAQAYKQDIDSFLNLIYKKNKDLNQISSNDINEYFDYLKKECLSTAYALRRLGALKLFCKFLSQEYELQDYTYLVTDLEIPKFPIFCRKSQIIKILQSYETIDYQKLRNKILVSLLFNYGLSVKEISKLTFEDLENNNIKIYKNNKLEYIRLKLEDQELIESYKNLFQKTNNYSSFYVTNSKKYVFSKMQNFDSEPMPLQALWSLLRKLFLQSIEHDILSHDLINQTIRSTNLQAEVLKVDYIKKHPRAQL